jgi:plastocyanin
MKRDRIRPMCEVWLRPAAVAAMAGSIGACSSAVLPPANAESGGRDAAPSSDASGAEDRAATLDGAAEGTGPPGGGGASDAAGERDTGDAGGAESGSVVMVLVGPSGDHSFLPATAIVPVGTTIQWFWESPGHSVASGAGGVSDGLFCSPNNSNCANTPVSDIGTIYEVTFTTPGTYPYFCAPHYSVGMKGTIVVQ